MENRMDINEYYITFGVQYTGDERTGMIHPMGMLASGYAVIEAPSHEIAANIAHAIFGDKYAFVYDWEHFMGDGTFERWYQDQEGPLLTIKWVQP